MSVRDLFWFMAGLMVTAAAIHLWSRVLPDSARTGRSLWRTPVAWGVGAAFIATAVTLYLWLGAPSVLTGSATAVSHGTPTPGSTAAAAGSMDAVLGSLEKRLAAGGGTAADWQLLAQTYEFLGRSEDAAGARQQRLPSVAATVTPEAGFASSASIAPIAAPVKHSAPGLKLIEAATSARRKRDFSAARAAYVQLAARGEMDADNWADYADVSASSDGGSLKGEPEKFLASALRLDPGHPKALWLLASLQHESARYDEAIATWRKLAAVMSPDSSDAKIIASNLAEDQRLAASAGQGTGASAPQSSGIAVDGEVQLSDALRGQSGSGLTLFIFARSVDSPGAPVAVLRMTTGTWPVRFHLDDSLAMVPDRKLSTAGKVTVEARISRSGQAATQPGDLKGNSAPLMPGPNGKTLRIVIDKVQG